MGRIGEDTLPRAELDHLPGVHNPYVPGDPRHGPQIVGDEEKSSVTGAHLTL